MKMRRVLAFPRIDTPTVLCDDLFPGYRRLVLFPHMRPELLWMAMEHLLLAASQTMLRNVLSKLRQVLEEGLGQNVPIPRADSALKLELPE
jgi:hypothetical protein